MTIDKAIELQELYLKSIMPSHLTDLHKAMKLGIEALKRLQRERKYATCYADGLLPGEGTE